MGRFLIQIGKYFLITLILANALALLSQYSLLHSSIFKATFLINNFDPGVEFDYIISGSSRGLTSIGSKEIDQLISTNGINLSQDDTGLPSHIIMAKHFFESGYRSRHCILVLDDSHFENSSKEINDNDYRLAPFLHKPYIYSYFKEKEKGIMRPYTYGRFMPAILYGHYNTELFFPSLFTLIKPSYRHRFDSFGNYTYPEKAGENSSAYEDEFKVSKKPVTISNPMITEFKEYLKEHNCELVIYIAPYQNMDIIIENELDIPIINHSSALQDKILFYDPIHLNHLGMKEASLLLSQSLQKIMTH